MTDLKAIITLVYEAARYIRSDGKHCEVLQGPRQIADQLASSRWKSLRERYTPGILSSATLDVAAKQKTLEKLQYLNPVSTFAEHPRKKPASKVFGVEIKDGAESTLNLLNANPSKFMEPTLKPETARNHTCPVEMDSGLILQSPTPKVRKAHTWRQNG
ncbi:hypothetical protein ARMSODRAFT_1024932 [Armillaria solidipes]|uniref:Uncharacterized protein n=1 Tax=Armillaria solidipes TaxID=1076256 RepID=A0A2H3BCM2_9AGAR|nr:hypothetical protein ARMSODRAFT_1024932 [Armillaria solidipes]